VYYCARVQVRYTHLSLPVHVLSQCTSTGSLLIKYYSVVILVWNAVGSCRNFRLCAHFFCDASDRKVEHGRPLPVQVAIKEPPTRTSPCVWCGDEWSLVPGGGVCSSSIGCLCTMVTWASVLFLTVRIGNFCVARAVHILQRTCCRRRWEGVILGRVGVTLQ
jgi:hypothetical protein